MADQPLPRWFGERVSLDDIFARTVAPDAAYRIGTALISLNLTGLWEGYRRWQALREVIGDEAISRIIAPPQAED